MLERLALKGIHPGASTNHHVLIGVLAWTVGENVEEQHVGGSSDNQRVHFIACLCRHVSKLPKLYRLRSCAFEDGLHVYDGDRCMESLGRFR